MEGTSDADARDAGMIAATQAVEHYEIMRYDTMISRARTLGKSEIAQLLRKTLDQEYAADQELTKLAESTLNREAVWPP